MRFLDAIHQLEDVEVEIFFAAHGAEHGVNHPGGTMDVEAQLR